MKNPTPSNESNQQLLIDRLNDLDMRMSKIEQSLKYVPQVQAYLRMQEEEEEDFKIRRPKDTAIESNLVEYGLTWLSTIVFILGVIFLMAYIRNIGFPLIASLTGYMAATGIFVFTYLFRKSLSHIINFLNTSGFLLVYIVTVRLHYFSTEPIITNTGLAIMLVSVAIGAFIWYTLKRKNEFLSFLSLLLLVITGIIIDGSYLTLGAVAIAAGLSLFYFVRHDWWRQLVAAILLVYLAHLLWLLGNPFMGHSLKMVGSHQNNIVFLFLYGIIFSSTIIVSGKDKISDNVLGFISVLNAFTFSLLILLLTFAFYRENYTGIYAAISVSCLSFSIFLKYRSQRIFAPAFYACFGFMALSVFIYGFAGLPDTFYWLALQSLAVVTMALWFRSRLIVVVNAVLYILILIIYLTSSPHANSINFVFAIVALVTARIINWKKDRLTLKTEIYRNVYLIIAFFVVLYALNHAFPTEYVTLAWTGAAIVYLLLSILLKNSKYRWMGFLTLVFTGGHLLFVDMAKMDIGFKVVAFLVFAAITIGLTLYYTKWIKKKTTDEEGSDA